MRSGPDERQQIGVELILVGGSDAVRSARVDLEDRILHQLGRRNGRGADRHDLVVVAVHD